MSTLSTTNLKNPSSGSNNVVLAADGTTTITAPSNIIKSGTSVASTSGTAIDFTGIPSWVKRVTVMFQGVSTNGTSSHSFLLGTSGGFVTSGYLGSSGYFGGTPASTNLSTSFVSYSDLASDLKSGIIVFTLIGSNTWACAGQFAFHARAFTQTTTGHVSLSGTLDRIRITTANGTDTFDAGTINLLWEG